MYYWDGRRWTSTLSPDGRYRWNGAAWEPVSAYAAPPYNPAAPRREPTSWTRPLQIAVAARYAAAGVYGLSLPLLLGGYMSQVMQASLQRQEQAYPNGAPPPAFTDMMTSVMTGSLWAGAIIGVALAVVVIVAAVRRWTWAYYVVLALLALTLLGTVYNLIDILTGGALTAAAPVKPPLWNRVFAVMFGVVDAGLFVGMMVALVRSGPWAMRRIT